MTAIMRALRDSISIDWDGPADHAAVQRPAAALFRSSRASVRWEVKEDKAGDNEHMAVRVGVVGWKKCNWLRWSGETSEFPAQQPAGKQTKGNQLKNVFVVYFLFGETDISLRYSAERGDFSFFVDKRRNWEQFPCGKLKFLMTREEPTKRTLKQHIQHVLLRSHARNGRGAKKVGN